MCKPTIIIGEATTVSPPGTPRIGETNDTFTMVPEGIDEKERKKSSKKSKKEPSFEFRYAEQQAG